jgi:protein-ribulosamine 3-kinase
MERFAAIAREITALTGTRCALGPQRRVTGGSINECYCWPGDAGAMFVKVAAPEARAMFAAEAAGLAELEWAHAVRVPRVLATGLTQHCAFLALEWIETGVAGPDCEARLGTELAALHAVTAPRFGWARDNTIGRTPQVNAASEDWAEFFRERRLRPQLEMAAAHGFADLPAAAGERLLESVPRLLAGHRPAASLLHGDLWGGNWLAALSGEPVLIDPAVYYGDRETDLAMTRLFGGFGERFYQAYQAAAPLALGWQARAELYNLYHVLNHANLFGGGYARQARAMIEHLLAPARR